MGFSGGGSNVTKPHTHDSGVVQDGGSLAANVTQFGLSAGSILYSDGSNIQELGVGSAAEALVVNGAANAPEWASAGATSPWTNLGADVATTGQASLEVSGFAAHDVLQLLFKVQEVSGGYLKLGTNGVTANYNSRFLYNIVVDTTNGATGWRLTEGNDADHTVIGSVLLFKPDSNADFDGQNGLFHTINTYAPSYETSYTMMGGVANNQTADITTVTLTYTGGNLFGNLTVNGMNYS